VASKRLKTPGLAEKWLRLCFVYFHCVEIRYISIDH